MNEKVKVKWEELMKDYKYFVEGGEIYASRAKRKLIEIQGFISAVECYDEKIAEQMSLEIQPF